MTMKANAVNDRHNDWDRRGLPAWTYHSEVMLELERRELFINHWQVAGHVSEWGRTNRDEHQPKTCARLRFQYPS